MAKLKKAKILNSIKCFLFWVIPLTSALAQEISTGLVDPCKSEIESFFPPGAPMVSYEASGIKPRSANPDLSDFLPAIGDQGVYAACTAFSVASALTILKYQEEKRKFPKIGPQDPNLLYSPSFVFNIGKSRYPIPRKTNCSDGISFIDAFRVVSELGIPLNGNFKYKIQGNVGCDFSIFYPSAKVKEEASKNKIYTFQRVHLDINSFKYLLSNGKPKPINIAVKIDKNYQAALEDAKGEWLTKGSKIPGKDDDRHAMLVVGYSDSKKAFKVLDSRGPLKGDHGFLWLSFDFITEDVIYDAYVCSLTEDILNDIKKQPGRKGDIDVDLETPHPTWIKEGYYRTFNGVRLGCLSIGKRNDSVSLYLQSTYNQFLELDSIGMKVGQEQLFNFGNNIFLIKVKKIGIAGTNPFTPAARIDITFKGAKAIEEYDDRVALNEFIRLIPQVLGSKAFESSQYLYTNFNVTLGDILDKTGNLVYRVRGASEKGHTSDSTVEITGNFNNSLLFCVGDSLRNRILQISDSISYKLELEYSELNTVQLLEEMRALNSGRIRVNNSIVTNTVKTKQMIIYARQSGRVVEYVITSNLPVFFKRKELK